MEVGYAKFEHLGVNKMGKNIRKSPLQKPNFSNNGARLQPQPQVYNVSKNEFRNVVQQLTGWPSKDMQSRPPQSMRLQKIRPPPLSAINRPQTPPYAGGSLIPAPQFPPLTAGNVFWTSSRESPVTAYMRYLQTYMASPSPRGESGKPPLQPPIQSQNVAQFSAGNPTNPPPSNSVSSLLSPGFGFSPILSPDFSFSPLAHRPPSPCAFPLSPAGFCPFPSPKW